MRGETAQHYAQGNILAGIKEALKDGPWDDISSLDEFHARGREATEDLVPLLNLSPYDCVLDCGCGLGGTMRWIISHCGCRVVGVDITEAYLAAGLFISQSLGMEKLTPFVLSDVGKLPFRSAQFDAIISQHVMMNIPYKEAVLREWRRVLKKGGKVAMNEVVKIKGEPDYPVPWARGKELSFLVEEEHLCLSLMEAGFEVIHWEDKTPQALEWFFRNQSKGGKISLRLLMGPEMRNMAKNFRQALEDGRLGLREIVVGVMA